MLPLALHLAARRRVGDPAIAPAPIGPWRHGLTCAPSASNNFTVFSCSFHFISFLLPIAFPALRHPSQHHRVPDPYHPSLPIRDVVPTANMSLAHESEMEKTHQDGPPGYNEPRHSLADHAKGRQLSITPADVEMVEADRNQLKKALKGRHMQMIALYVSPVPQ